VYNLSHPTKLITPEQKQDLEPLSMVMTAGDQERVEQLVLRTKGQRSQHPSEFVFQ
jgi:hypothetical protein